MRLACPARAQGMHLDNLLSGRRERRLPVMVMVRLKTLDRVPAEEHERAYTNNVSGYGACVVSTHLWRAGERAEITLLDEDCPVRGEVVYCTKLDETHFSIGLKFSQRRLSWSVLQGFDVL